MKYRIVIFMLLAISLLYSKVVIDPNCNVTFGPSDIYISGGLQLNLVRSEEPKIDLTRKILGKDIRSNIRTTRNDISTKDEAKNTNIIFDTNSRLYFIGDGDADLVNVYDLHNTTIAKPSGNLNLNSDLLISGNLDFVSGNLITGVNTVTLAPTVATLTNETATAYIIGNVEVTKSVGTGTSTFSGIGFVINNTGNDLGNVTVNRQAGSGSAVTIYGSNGIQRKWTVSSSVAFSGTRNATVDWLSNEDNGNVLADLKVWKYEASKGVSDSDKDIFTRKKISLKPTAKSGICSEREFTESVFEDDIDAIIVESDPKTLGWVEVTGASFNTASSPRTSTFTIDAATIFTINDVLNAFADGSGTEGNPYQIETLDQLDAVRYYTTAHFIQIAEIDASATTTWDSGSGWTPINNFTGKYNGDGHTVSNLFINRSGTLYIGLFGYTTSGSEIKDIGLINVDITGGDYTGGFVGYSRGTVKNTFSKGEVNSSSGYRTGGFVGYATTGNAIYDCYAYVDVTRLSGGTDDTIAGFCGYQISGPIERCYSTGAVYYDTTNPTNKGFAGYVAGGTMANNFWNTETSDQTSTAGTATGLTTAEMRTLSTFTDATWDFQDESANGVEDIWGMNFLENNAFPFLSWQGITHDPISGFAGGMGTELEPFLISTPVELDNVRNFLGASNDNTYFLQTANLDLSGYSAGEGWEPLGSNTTTNFRGSYDGAGYRISNLTINKPTADYLGLFGYSYSGCVIKNIGIINADVIGNAYIGILIGRHYGGNIENCYVSGDLNGVNIIGGLVGYVSSPAVITNSYSHVNVTRASGISAHVGGFCGRNYNGTINKSYSVGGVYYADATDPTDKGFLGSVGTATMVDNFWDMEASGQTTSAGGATGKTTAEMQDIATYTNTATVGLTNSWDFVGNPNDDVANNDFWNIHISLNGGYPYFEYENRIPVLAPGNIALVYSAGDVTLTWDAVADAAGYAVYSSDDPYGTFSLDESGTFNGEEWTITTADSKMFYFVTATNATKETPKVITMSNKVADR